MLRGHVIDLICIAAQFMTQIPKSRTDLLPHYSRLIATLNKYMLDIGRDVVDLVRPLSMYIAGFAE